MKPKVCLLTYADEKYEGARDVLLSDAYKLDAFDRFFTYSRSDIDADFVTRHRKILDCERGGGYWLWKPYFLRRALQELSDGDILLYMDAGDGFFPGAANTSGDVSPKGIKGALLDIMKDKDMCLTVGAYRHSDWCKRDCFYIMNCDKPEFYNRIQLEAGVAVFKNNSSSQAIVGEWLSWSKNPSVLTDEPNVCGRDNLFGFVEHRHDQAILTNLYIKYGLYASNEMRNFIKCNVSIPA